MASNWDMKLGTPTGNHRFSLKTNPLRTRLTILVVRGLCSITNFQRMIRNVVDKLSRLIVGIYTHYIYINK